MLTMTDTAAEAVRQISAGSGLEPEPGLRISAGAPTPDGTPLEVDLAAEAGPSDQTVENGGAHVYRDELVAPALDDKVLDAEIEGDQIRFALRDAPATNSNGNRPGTCRRIPAHSSAEVEPRRGFESGAPRPGAGLEPCHANRRGRHRPKRIGRAAAEFVELRARRWPPWEQV